MARAHDLPFSYIDVAVGSQSIGAEIVVHVADLARDFSLAAPEELLDPAVIAAHKTAVLSLLESRFRLEVNGFAVSPRWSDPELLQARQAVRVRVSYPTVARPDSVRVTARLFPFAPEHQTFLSIREEGLIVAQELLAGERTSAEHFAQTRQGRWTLLTQFARSGIHHILIGPDHLLFLTGLLLAGGQLPRLLLIVTAFTLAHSLTLSLAVLSVVSVPGYVVEPAIALSVIYVGADNLLRRGQDRRAWIALAFGLIHGFGFAGVLEEVGLPSADMMPALLAFNAGVEVGQVAVVAVAAAIMFWVRKRSEVASRRMVVAGSVFVMAAGAYWLLERIL